MQQQIVLKSESEFQMNVTPQVIRSIITLQQIATQLIAKDQK